MLHFPSKPGKHADLLPPIVFLCSYGKFAQLGAQNLQYLHGIQIKGNNYV
jgi:hypothetical protein